MMICIQNPMYLSIDDSYVTIKVNVISVDLIHLTHEPFFHDFVICIV